MPIPNNPIINSGLFYVNGLQISNVSGNVPSQQLNLTKGLARNSTNIADIVLSSNVLIDASQKGRNGVDIGPLLPNRFYAVYVIGDSTDNTPTAGLLSLATNPSPYFPVGYDMYRRIGWVLTDGTSNIVTFTQLGVDENRTYYYKTFITVLIGGSSTSYAPIDLSGAVPPIFEEGTTSTNQVFLTLDYLPALVSNFAQFHYANFISSPPGVVFFGYGTTSQVGSVVVPSQEQKIFYRVQSGDSLLVNVSGYTDYLSG